MEELIDYRPAGDQSLTACLGKALANLSSRDIIMLESILGVVIILGVGIICFSGSELIIENGRLVIRRPKEVSTIKLE